MWKVTHRLECIYEWEEMQEILPGGRCYFSALARTCNWHVSSMEGETEDAAIFDN